MSWFFKYVDLSSSILDLPSIFNCITALISVIVPDSRICYDKIVTLDNNINRQKYIDDLIFY